MTAPMSTTWSMVINNPDANDYAIVMQGYPDYVRELVWTKEIGENGTEHIQAYVKLQRTQRMSFIKKLFPRGHFKPCDRDEYNVNTKRYVQKDDTTTAGQHRQVYHDPIPAADTLLYSLVEKVLAPDIEDMNIMLRKARERNWYGVGKEQWLVENSDFGQDPDLWAKGQKEEFKKLLSDAEHELVREKRHIEKLLVSPTYSKIKKEWLWDIVARIYKHAYDNSCLEQDAGGPVVVIDLPVTEGYSEGSPDEDGEDDSDSEQDSEAGDSESD